MVRDLPAPIGAGRYNVYTGVDIGEPDSAAVPTAARLGLEPPRFCAACGRRMVVQVRPDGWWAQCSRHGRVDSDDLEAQIAPSPADVGRTSRRRAVGTVVAGLLLTGVPLGALWAWMAPAVHGVVVLTHRGERVQDYPGAESQHFFVAAVLLLGLLSTVAVVAAALVWQWRAHRGPGMVVALGLGVLGAASVAAAEGAVLVHLHYGTVNVGSAPVTHDHPVYYFTEAPPVFFGHTPLQIACTLLVPVASAALAYAVPVATTDRDDLGHGDRCGVPGPKRSTGTVIADAGARPVR